LELLPFCKGLLQAALPWKALHSDMHCQVLPLWLGDLWPNPLSGGQPLGLYWYDHNSNNHHINHSYINHNHDYHDHNNHNNDNNNHHFDKMRKRLVGGWEQVFLLCIWSGKLLDRSDLLHRAWRNPCHHRKPSRAGCLGYPDRPRRSLHRAHRLPEWGHLRLGGRDSDGFHKLVLQCTEQWERQPALRLDQAWRWVGRCALWDREGFCLSETDLRQNSKTTIFMLFICVRNWSEKKVLRSIFMVFISETDLRQNSKNNIYIIYLFVRNCFDKNSKNNIYAIYFCQKLIWDKFQRQYLCLFIFVRNWFETKFQGQCLCYLFVCQKLIWDKIPRTIIMLFFFCRNWFETKF